MSPRFATPAEVAQATRATQPSNVPPRLFDASPPPTTTRTIIGIDPSRHCGWCARFPGGSIKAGVWHLRRNDKVGMGEALALLDAHLDGLIERTQPDLLAFELVVMHQCSRDAHWYGAFMGKIHEVCQRKAVECREIHYSHIKRAATGKGNANKAAMIEAARRRWPSVPLEDDNQADAMWIAETAALQP